jgi:hypothetical protein
MMTGATDLLESERGVVCILLLLAVTILVVLGKLTGEQWLSYTQFVVGILVASKTITGMVETVKNGKSDGKPANPVVTA